MSQLPSSHLILFTIEATNRGTFAMRLRVVHSFHLISGGQSRQNSLNKKIWDPKTWNSWNSSLAKEGHNLRDFPGQLACESMAIGQYRSVWQCRRPRFAAEKSSSLLRWCLISADFIRWCSSMLIRYQIHANPILVLSSSMLCQSKSMLIRSWSYLKLNPIFIHVNPI